MHRIAIYLFAFCSTLLAVACGRTPDTQVPARNTPAQTEKQTVNQNKTKTVILDAVVFSYLDRPIFDVFLNGKWVGDSGAYPATGGGTITGVTVQLGIQKITWRYADTGETVAAQNAPELAAVPRGHSYLAIHEYPNNTVELLTPQNYPSESARGTELSRNKGAKHGQ
jgi:hypothetical protein